MEIFTDYSNIDSKEERYSSAISQIISVIEDESDPIANMANIVAILKSAFNHFWVGFYMVKGDDLVLSPFQGPLACTRIKKGRGVCGAAWSEGRSFVVPNVEEFPGHIACSSSSKSEIVVPILDELNQVIGVLDIDSDELDSFDAVDLRNLEHLAKIVCNFIKLL